MKNMRNIVAAIVMVTILSVSTTFADGIIIGGKDGIIIGGKSGQTTKTQPSCSETKFGVVSTITGIIIGGFTGIIIGGRDGIIIGGRSSCDQSRDGLIISY